MAFFGSCAAPVWLGLRNLPLWLLVAHSPIEPCRAWRSWFLLPGSLPPAA